GHDRPPGGDDRSHATMPMESGVPRRDPTAPSRRGGNARGWWPERLASSRGAGTDLYPEPHLKSVGASRVRGPFVAARSMWTGAHVLASGSLAVFSVRVREVNGLASRDGQSGFVDCHESSGLEGARARRVRN